MDSLIIEGPAKLSGTVTVSGSKNTTLPLLFASLLFDKEIQFENVPRLWDVETTLKLLETMGSEFSWNKDLGRVSILPRVRVKVAPYEWVRRMRAGILALGPLLAKYGEARVSLPGGCAIGARPVNYHLEAMKRLGVGIEVEEGYIKAQIRGELIGCDISFPQVTVTGTENILILALSARGTTRISNAAREPEVVRLGEMLRDCGAHISGLGTSTIEVQGGELRPPAKPILIPSDRIEAATWIAASVATRCPLTIDHTDNSALGSVIQAYRALGAKIEGNARGTSLFVEPRNSYASIEIETAPYPGFPTDMQAQILTNACLAHGTSKIRETIFENRFMHVAELRRLGAKVSVRRNVATVEGPTKLVGAPLMATDLRASACLVLGGLSAYGQTKVSRIYHLDRGYQRLDEKLRHLGAKIQRGQE